MKKVLVAIPCKPQMHPTLKQKMESFSGDLVHNNPGFHVEVIVFSEKVERDPRVQSIYAHVAKARNIMVERFIAHRRDLDYVFWIDADLVFYTPDVILRLHAINPDGVTAPLVLVENAGKPSDSIFYDVAAFVESGQPVYHKGPHYGNVAHAPPYFDSTANVVDCDCVGCCYLLPAHIQRQAPPFAPTPFTDHFPVVHYAKEQGLRVCCARNVIAYHAYLPNYGENWHAEPMEPWATWPVGDYFKVRDGVRPDSKPPRPAPKLLKRIPKR